MPIRRLVLDVDMAVSEPSLPELARALENVPGVEAVNVTVTEIDIETIGTVVTIEGEALDPDTVQHAIEHVGAVLHSIDEVVTGSYTLNHTSRKR
ncbi:DUF211 domain-containing protein [Streptomyces reniochalinae]|uniref:DUF211 domain-containing protein n=1 Tax=Streptomyces reniochalinae TaxID=2250578 RepID=A0A367EMU3_9ACTN|nr:DUF211 domain-containing protein [Streptomyces reniochalinae]RCG18707.1 hypothetical protein DQ392_12315 [Streptomyces reniochalinae]